MPKQIKKLTQAQKDMMPKVAAEWAAKGMSCEPGDPKVFESAVHKCYKFANLAPPKVILQAGSPFGAVTAGPVAAFRLERDFGEQPQPEERVREYLEQAIKDTWGTGPEKLSKEERNAVADGWGTYFGGRPWCAWLANAAFLRDVCHLELEGDLWDRYDAYADADMQGWWWWPYDEFVVWSPAPKWIDCDAAGRPHSGDRRAVEWEDGYGLYAWHGVTVPAHVITNPGGLTVSMVDAESNAEVRRAMLERMTPEKYLLESGTVPVHRDRFGVLYRRDVQGDEPIVMVRLLNSTPESDGTLSEAKAREVFGDEPVDDSLKANPEAPKVWKEYWIRVDPEHLTAHAAVASMHGMVPAKEPVPWQSRQGDVLLTPRGMKEYWPSVES